MISGERNGGSNDEKVTAFFQAVTKTFFPCTEKLCLLVNSGAGVKSDKNIILNKWHIRSTRL